MTSQDFPLDGERHCLKLHLTALMWLGSLAFVCEWRNHTPGAEDDDYTNAASKLAKNDNDEKYFSISIHSDMSLKDLLYARNDFINIKVIYMLINRLIIGQQNRRTSHKTLKSSKLIDPTSMALLASYSSRCAMCDVTRSGWRHS